jgi:hypothetical protein
MSGQTESNLDIKIQELERQLEEYTTTVGLRHIIIDSSVENYMHMNQKEMLSLSSEECAGAEAVLTKAAAHIQLQTNKYAAKVRWCQDYITHIIAENIHQYGNKYTPYEYKRRLAIQDSEVATKLEQIRVQVQLLIDTMEYIPTHMRQVAKSFENIQKLQRG